MLENQNGVCAICNKPETKAVKGVVQRLVVDRAIADRRVRGLLCHSCKALLTWANDDPEMILGLQRYIERRDY